MIFYWKLRSDSWSAVGADPVEVSVDFGDHPRKQDAALLHRAPNGHAEQCFLPVGVNNSDGRPSITLWNKKVLARWYFSIMSAYKAGRNELLARVDAEHGVQKAVFAVDFLALQVWDDGHVGHLQVWALERLSWKMKILNFY